jgi:hypothetical protein
MPFAVAIVRALPSPALGFFTALPFNPTEHALYQSAWLNLEYSTKPHFLELELIM